MSKAQLVVCRLSGTRDRLRAYRVEVDGVECGVINEGAVWSTSLPPGRHTVRGLVDWYRSKLVTVDAPEDGVARIYLQSGAVARIDLDMLRREGYIQIGLEADLERMQHTTEATRIDKVCGIALVSLRKVESGHAPRLGPGEANARTCPPKAH